MTRLKQAWLALCGKLEPERVEVRVPVIGEPAVTKLYCVNVPDPDGGTVRTIEGGILWMKRVPHYYATCAQAHATHPDEYVKEVSAVYVGGQYLIGDFKFAEVQPKPKRPKGKPRG